MAAARGQPDMTTDALDPVIHAPGRLRIAATLAALPEGDALRVTRPQHMLRLTLGELNARLGAALAATTHGELSRATRDLPEATVVSAPVSFSRGTRRRPGHPPGPVAGRGTILPYSPAS